MAAFLTFHHLANFFGILGNIVSFIVFLSPSTTFYNIYKAKSTQGFDPIPYSVALFSCMLTGYYGLVKHNILLITINSVGIVIESFYLTIYMIFAPRREKLNTTKLLLSFNVGLLTLIILLTTLVTHGTRRDSTVGWICAIFSVCVFASPLSVIRTVITTKSVEFLPFWLSFSLTISAIIWFLFGYFVRDLFVALPNVLGLIFGISQMSLYFIYKNPKKNPTPMDMDKASSELSVLDFVKVELSQNAIDEEVAKKIVGEKCSIEDNFVNAKTILDLEKPPLVACVV